MLKSQKARLDAPEMDSLRLGSGWKTEELDLPQIFVAEVPEVFIWKW